MGSATREATVKVAEAASSVFGAGGLESARELFQAVRALERNPQLVSALADPVADASARASLASRVFGSLGASAKSVLEVAVRERWSSADDLLDALERAGIRLAASSADGDIAGEVLRFAGIVSEHPELELALGGILTEADRKAAIVDRLLAGKATPQTIEVLDHLVRSPRGRRFAQLATIAAREIAAASDATIATITTATPLPDAQLERLRAGLSQRYGRKLQVQQQIDPSVIGGLRVAVADEVIDGTVRSKFNDLRLQLG